MLSVPCQDSSICQCQSFITVRVCSTTWGYVFTRVLTGGGGSSTYLGWGKGPWMGEGVSWIRRGYLPWTGGGGTDLGWEKVPTFDCGEGGAYLPWTGYATGSTPLAASRRRTFLYLGKYFYQVPLLGNMLIEHLSICSVRLHSFNPVLSKPA